MTYGWASLTDKMTNPLIAFMTSVSVNEGDFPEFTATVVRPLRGSAECWMRCDDITTPAWYLRLSVDVKTWRSDQILGLGGWVGGRGGTGWYGAQSSCKSVIQRVFFLAWNVLLLGKNGAWWYFVARQHKLKKCYQKTQGPVVNGIAL